MFHLEKNILRSYLFISLCSVCFILHNFVYEFFQREEAVFFSLTFIFFLSFIISIIINLIKDRDKEIWKLGGIGFFALLGSAFNFQNLYYFILFFFFFLFKLLKNKKDKNK
jgi:hypothetical protein